MQDNITKLIQQVAEGHRAAVDLLFPMLYEDLQRIARHSFAGERQDHTLQPTAIVHEAYLQLIQQHSLKIQNRSHFLALSAVLMRRILMEQARTRFRKKRGGKATRIEFQDDISAQSLDMEQLVDLDAALIKLEALDARQVRIVELRFFGGLSMAEVADVLQLSLRTVESDWHMARAWLKRELGGPQS